MISIRNSHKITRNTAFSLPETLLIVVILGIISAIGLGGLLREDRRNNALAAANDIAGWLEAVRRNSERGSGCLVSFTSATVSNATKSTELARSSVDGSSSIPNQCRPNIPLFITSTADGKQFRISVDPVTSFVFTPRGTVFNTSSTEGSFASPIQISVNTSDASNTWPPMYCVVIRPPMGEIDVISNGSATSGRCN